MSHAAIVVIVVEFVLLAVDWGRGIDAGGMGGVACMR